MSRPDAFEPVTIGRSPSRAMWTAYRPQDVEPMRRRLREAWEDHLITIRIDCRSVAGVARHLRGVYIREGKAVKGKPAALRAFAAAIRANPPAEWVGHDPMFVAAEVERVANIERVTG